MGKRSRKRVATEQSGRAAAPEPSGGAPPSAAPPPAAAGSRHRRPLDRRARLSEAPKAPWSPFPLVELSVLLAIGLIVTGLFSEGRRQRILLITGVVLATLAGLELSIREHFAGYRSHTTLLAGVCTVAVIMPLTILVRPPQEAILATGLAIFGFAFYLLRAAFARRTGGLGFRV